MEIHEQTGNIIYIITLRDYYQQKWAMFLSEISTKFMLRKHINNFVQICGIRHMC